MDKSIVPANQLSVCSSTCYEFSNPNRAEVVEIEDEDTLVENIEKQIENLKLNYQVDEKDVPQIFQNFIHSRMSGFKEVYMGLKDSSYFLKFDDWYVQFVKMDDSWVTIYNDVNTTIETADPVKSIIDHFWFVLKNPNIKLDQFGILNYEDSDAEESQILDSEKLSILLQSMIDSIDHQIQTNVLHCKGFNEDAFLSMLKHVDSETLVDINFNLTWKEEGNYQKMKEIAEMDQWKQARTIYSHRITPLEIDEFFQYKNFWLTLDSVTPGDVLRVVEHAFNSSCKKFCTLFCEHKKYDIDAIIDVLRSQNDITRIVKIKQIPPKFTFIYTIVKFDKRVQLFGNGNRILISRI